MLRRLLITFGVCLVVNLFFIALPATTAAQNGLFVTGPDEGFDPVVRLINSTTGEYRFSFRAYPQNFTGGVRVATGDVNGDGVAEIITAPGPGMRPNVRIFEQHPRGVRDIGSFLAYRANFRGGVYVAAGDINGDGRDEIITGAGAGGGPVVRVVDGTSNTILFSFLAYDPSFRGGVRVATGDVNGDGRAEIITGAGSGGGPHVKVFNPVNWSLMNSFLAYDLNFTGGVFVAAGDVNGDGFADIVTGPGAGAGPHVKVFDARNNLMLLHSFFAFQSSFTGGVRVGLLDFNRDGDVGIIAGTGPGVSPQVRVFNTSQSVIGSFLPYPNFMGGVFVAGG